MKKEGYYSSGEFARMAHVTLRTIRYYDKQNILKPSYVSDAGARFYTDEDLARLQQILLLKFLGFSLDDIRDMTINDTDYHFMRDSLDVQLKLVRDRIEQLQLVEKAIQDTSDAIQTQHTIDWNQMLDLIHLTGMEKSMKNQYQNATNIAARIKLHSLYSINKEGWFPWIYSQCHLQSGMNVLELGCGDGALWKQNISLLPQNIHLTLSDISDGMLRDARRALGARDSRFSFAAFDCEKIPASSESYDLVIANHVLFYCDNLENVCKEVRRVLKPGGKILNFDANWYAYLYDDKLKLGYEQDRQRAKEEQVEDYYEGTDIAWMENIAKQVPLSPLKRPKWDLDVLKKIGLDCWADETIGERVLSDAEKINYQSTPVFMVCAVK